MEWFLFPWVFYINGCPLVDLFHTRANMELPLHVFPALDSMGWKQDAFQHPWDDVGGMRFPHSFFSDRSCRE